MQQIAYSNLSDAPPAGIQVDWTFNDGNSGAQGSGGALTATGSVTVDITAVNDAPILDNSGIMTLTTITEDEINNPGQTVASILTSSGGTPISDPDGPGSLQGIAITATDSGNGTWQYSIDGGTTWLNVGVVNNTNALLLRDTDRVRFVPNAENSTTAEFTFRAWDQTSGSAGQKVDVSVNGGTTAFSTATEVASIVVTDVNDAPAVNSTAYSIGTTDENTTSTAVAVSSVLAGTGYSDVDGGALSGLAITAISGDGTWQYSTDGSTWNEITSVSGTNALLLTSTSQIRYIPNGINGETAAFEFRAWDQTSGTASTNGSPSYADPGVGGGTTAYSSATATAQLTVTDVNDAPVISIEVGDSIADTLVETNSSLQTQGTLTVTDVDLADTVTASVTGVVASGTTSGLISNNAALLAMLSVNANVIDGSSTSGQINWDFDSSSEAFNYLAVGESLILTYTVQVEDSQGATDPQEVIVTVTGTNDVPLISVEAGDSAAETLSVTGATLTSGGTLSVADLDRSDTVTAAITGFSRLGADTGLTLSNAQLEALLSLNANVIDAANQAGTINWAFDSAGYTFGYLGSGQSLTLTYTITVTDTQGTTDTQDITIVINGDNSTPVISVEPGDSDNDTLAETDTTLATTGTLSVIDINTTDVVTSSVTQVVTAGTTTGLQSNNAALLAMLSLNANVIDGTSETGTITWSFSSGSEAFDYLAVGESLVLTYTVQVEDSQGATDTQAVVITVTGTNDAPVITISGSDSVGDSLGVTGATLTTDGTLTVSDLDRSDSVTAAVTTFSKTGDLTGLTLSDAQLEAMLALNASVIDAANQAGTINWAFDSAGYTFGYLAANESITLVYTITVTDSQGTTDTQDITIVINGDNSAPVISVEAGDSDAETLAETDTPLATSGTLSVTDINTTDIVTADVTTVIATGTTAGLQSNNAALLAMLSLNASVIDGTTETGTIAWSFDSATEAFDYLAVGEFLTLTYTVQVTDSQGATDTQEVTITVTGTNDVPVITISGSDSVGDSLGVTGATLTTDGTLTVSDLDRSDAVTAAVTTFSKTGDLTGLTLSDAQLEAMLALNASVIDAANQAGTINWAFDSAGYTFGYLGANESITLVYTITVTDSQGTTDTQDITIVINGDNSAPVISVEAGDSDADTLAETDTTLATSGTLSVIDINTTDIVTADVTTVIATGTTAGLQSNNAALLAMLSLNASVIDGTTETGTIAWSFDSGSEAFDYLAVGEFLTLTYTVQVTDSQGATDTQEVAITVIGTNDTPVISSFGGIDTVVLDVDENVTSFATVSATDADQSNSLLFSITGGTDAGLFTVDAITGLLSFINPPDYENPLDSDGDNIYEVIIQVSDGQETDQQRFVISLIDLNDTAPLILAKQEFVVSELAAIGTTVGDIHATDADTVGTLQGWTIVGGNSDGVFAINPATGRITVANVASLDFETTDLYTLTLTVSDGVSISAPQTIRIFVQDENEAPVFSIAPVLSVNENSVNGALVGSVVATDPDSGDSLTYSITGGGAASPFAVDAVTGQIRVIDSSQLDFETVSSFTLNILVSDAAGLTDAQSIVITVIDVNEAPTALSLTGGVVEENSAGGTIVATITGSDPDAGDVLTYSLVNSSGGRFVIDSSTGVLSVADGAVLNFEASSTHVVTVRGTDAAGLFYDKSFTIDVTDINEAPVAVADQYVTRQLTPLNLSGVNGLLANDFDEDGDPLSIRLISGPAHGILTWLLDGSLSYLATNNFYGTETFLYQITDGVLNSAVVSVTIDVLQVIAPGNWGSSGDTSNSHRDSSGDNSATDSTTSPRYSMAIPLAGSGLGTSTSGSSRFGSRDGSQEKDSHEIVSPSVSEAGAEGELLEAGMMSGFRIDGGQLLGLNRGSRSLAMDRTFTNLLGERLLMTGSFDGLVADGFFSLSKSTAASSPNDPWSPSAVADQIMIGSTTVVTTSLSVGYVIWLLRGGSLLTAFMSAMPTWQSFDPLPVLQSFEKSQEDDEESLLGIVTKRMEKRKRS